MIDLATEEAERRGGVRVSALHVKLGPLSGVVKDALLFSYEVASQGTLLEGSQLLIEDVPVVIYCRECEAERILESIQRFCCPVCGTLSSEVVKGRELEFVAMELEELMEPAEPLELAELKELAESEEETVADPVGMNAMDHSRQLEEAAT